MDSVFQFFSFLVFQFFSCSVLVRELFWNVCGKTKKLQIVVLISMSWLCTSSSQLIFFITQKCQNYSGIVPEPKLKNWKTEKLKNWIHMENLFLDLYGKFSFSVFQFFGFLVFQFWFRNYSGIVLALLGYEKNQLWWWYKHLSGDVQFSVFLSKKIIIIF